MYILEELLLVETIGKIIRLEFFLDDVKTHASDEEVKLLDFYNNVTKSIKYQIFHTFKTLKLYHGKALEEEPSRNCVKDCLTVFLAIYDLHLYLGYLPNVKARTETYTFLKNISTKVKYFKENEIEPVIVLSDVYNYGESNISQILIDRSIIDADDIKEHQIILELPKIEKDNPLMWPILIHEIGHSLDEDCLKISDEVFKSEIFKNHRNYRILKRWTKEIVSDYLSLRIIGPSYLLSFIYFNLLYGDLNKFTQTHPSPICRILFMKDILINKGFNIEVIDDFLKLLDARQSFNFYTEDNICPECKQDQKKDISNIDKMKKNFTQLLEYTVEIIKKLEIEDYEIQDYKHSKDLSNNLKKRIPISSSRLINDKNLKKLCVEFNKKNGDIYSLLDKFEEKPNSVANIVNAGWINKIDNSYLEFIKIFFEDDSKNNNTFEEKYENYKKFLIQNDELLLKSLEIADMHLLFEFGRSLL